MIFLALVGVALISPLAFAAWLLAGRALSRDSRRRRALGVALTGAIAFTPATLLFALGAYAGLSVFVLGWPLGAGYGLLVAAIATRRAACGDPCCLLHDHHSP